MLDRTLRRQVGRTMELRVLPGYVFLFFWAWILQPPNIDWAGFSHAVSRADAGGTGAAVGVGFALWSAAWSRTVRAVLFAEPLRWLWRSPAPAWHWAPWLARELHWVVLPVVLFSLLWVSPHPVAQAVTWGAALAPMQLAAAGTGPRGWAWFAAAGLLATGEIALGRAVPAALPGLAVVASGVAVVGVTGMYRDLMYRYIGPAASLPGRPRTPVAAMIRWDSTCLWRREPRVYAFAAGAAVPLAAMLYAFRVNGGLEGAGLRDAALLHLAAGSPVCALALYRLLEIQRGSLNPPALPVTPAVRVTALWVVGTAVLLPVVVGLTGVAGPLAGLRLAALAAWIAAVGVLFATRRDRARGHRLPFGLHLLAAGVATPFVVRWEAAGVGIAVAGTLACLALARWRLARVQGAA